MIYCELAYYLGTSSIDDLVSVNIETAYDAMIETPHHLWINNNTALTNIGIQTSRRLNENRSILSADFQLFLFALKLRIVQFWYHGNICLPIIIICFVISADSYRIISYAIGMISNTHLDFLWTKVSFKMFISPLMTCWLSSLSPYNHDNAFLASSMRSNK